MASKLIRKYTGPRSYVVVKNPKTGKAKGVTVRMGARQVMKRLEAVFSSDEIATSN